MRLPGHKIDPKRFDEIVRTLARYGLAEWLGKDIPDLIEKRLVTADGRSISDLSQEERIREAFTELGTTFIKLGQVLSTRADLVGPVLAEELSKLQADVPADPPGVSRGTIETELEGTPEHLYAEFKAEALASASIAQVHAATLEDGTRVVVKVQHPLAEDRVRKDLDILMHLAERAEALSPELEQYKPSSGVAEFRKNLLKELDFGKEVNNLQQVARNCADDPVIHIPAPYPDLSTRKVLTMERLDGYSVADTARMEAEGVDRKKLARHFADAYIHMILRDGVYHADPHPGNVLVLPGDRLGILDFGSVGRIDERTREEYEGIVLAAIFGDDADETTDYIVRICKLPKGFDRNALRADIGEFMSEYLAQNLSDIDLGSVAESAADIMRQHRIVMPGSLSLLFKVLAQVEGTARLMDLEFNLAEVLEPYYKDNVGEKLNPKKLLNRARRQIKDWERLIDRLPRDLNEMADQIRSGDFDVGVEFRRLDTITNRIVLGVLASALFLGSVGLYALKVPPMWGEVSVPAALGIVGFLYLAWRLLSAIRKTGDLGQRGP